MLGQEAWMLVVAISALGIGGMLLTMAAAIRRGVAVADLEVRVKQLRAEQRQRMIERGLIEPDEGDIAEAEVIEAIPVDDDEPEAERMAA
ncbi:MAG: hypothetical protein ACIAS6_13795 [Phycisphaerales bacterium JB060]